MEKQFNVWSIQEELYAIHGQKQLEKRLKALRDQYIEQLESKESKCEKTQKKHRCIIL
jgi:hypothetical protein